ncbi:hypothetical protein LP415_27740 [Polaromonas sp. P1(28)-8]|nr:hypothetical protein LP415_27740 [Polaromonas sp. P1(28)-8]
MNQRAMDGQCLPDTDAAYVCTRVVDALLREDVRGCVTRARLVRGDALTAGAGFPPAQRWLEISHFGAGRMWIAVTPERFMQSWRLTRLPLLVEECGQVQALFQVADILASFSAGADSDTRAFCRLRARMRGGGRTPPRGRGGAA